MEVGAITEQIDVGLVAFNVFLVFFILLIVYLRREDRREGYPLDMGDSRPDMGKDGFFFLPEPKVFITPHGNIEAPNYKGDDRPVNARAMDGTHGATLDPLGDPLADGIGPASFAERADIPDEMPDGAPKIVPLREASDYYLESRDPDPRGMKVVGGDGKVAGTVADVWVDKSEYLLRYMEVELPAAEASTAPVAEGEAPPPPPAPARVLLPINVCDVQGTKGRVLVECIHAHHFAGVPKTKNPTSVTLLEEDKIMAYYAAGNLYGDPGRLGPLL